MPLIASAAANDPLSSPKKIKPVDVASVPAQIADYVSGPYRLPSGRPLVALIHAGQLTVTGPDGALFHVAWFTGGGINVIDVWESPGQFDRFMETRLAPGIEQVGVAGQPNVTWNEAHAVFNPQALTAGAPA